MSSCLVNYRPYDLKICRIQSLLSIKWTENYYRPAKAPPSITNSDPVVYGDSSDAK